MEYLYVVLEHFNPCKVVKVEVVGRISETTHKAGCIQYLFLRSADSTGAYKRGHVYRARFSIKSLSDEARFPNYDPYLVAVAQGREAEALTGPADTELYEASLTSGGMMFQTLEEATEFCRSIDGRTT